MGANCSATVSPTAATLPVSSKMSQSMAMRAIHPPMLFDSPPMNDSRKLNTWNEAKTARHEGRRVHRREGCGDGRGISAEFRHVVTT